MERADDGSPRRGTRRKSNSSKFLRNRRPRPDFLFPLTLAALNNPHHLPSSALIKACLTQFLHLLLPNSPDSLSPPYDDQLLASILAPLPLLLKSRCSEIVCASLKVLGAASLISYEVNEKIATEEGEILRLLLPKLLCGNEKVAMAACNAALDVSSTSLGRQCLVNLSAINYLMLAFLQVMKSSSTSLSSICILEKKVGSCLGVQQREDELPMLLLTAAASLINFCSLEQLEGIPRKLLDMSIVHLKNIWAQLREQILCRKIQHGSNCCVSNLTTNNLAETAFRLSLNASGFASGITLDDIMRHLIGANKSSFQNFMSNYWELSPLHTKRLDMDLDGLHNIFDPLTVAESPKLERAFPSFLSPMLQGMVSCFPLASDDVDIVKFLKEVKSLACPILYQQDIRVVRTEPNLKREEHFFVVSPNNCCEKLPSAFTMGDILRCEEAYKEGYTVALRGMEFRFKNIAAIADKVASLFGQPAVGANLYLTPPNSQGLACHYDDHCVFVCQLQGSKLWTISPQPFVQLPRLFDCLDHPPNSVEGSREILLNEGDVLYIPRGFPHKACTFTTTNKDSGVANFSMHLTIAVEIEPPFEWEGFIHVALLHWSHSTKSSHSSHSCLSKDFDGFSIGLLHIAIRLISNSDPAFRKACLVAAVSLPSDVADGLDQNQRSIFDQLIDKIYEISKFSDALEYIKTSLQSNEDPFFWLRWLHVLDAEEDTLRHGLELPLEDIEELVTSADQHKENLEAKFVQEKARFCQEILFDDARERFKMMHAMFKKVRKQYTKGMLSLHC